MNYILIIFLSILILGFVISPNICILYTLKGAKLFFYSVFPSLFPFLVVCNIIVFCGGIELYAKLFGKLLCKPLKLPKNCSIVLIISFLCGYPLGAKYTCDLYKNNEIDFATSERLLNIATNPSPIFIIGTLGASMLKNPAYGYIILASVLISCFISSFIYKNDNNKIFKTTFIAKSKEKACKKISSNRTPGEILKESIDNALSNTLMVAGFVIIFSVITGFISNAFSILHFKNVLLNGIIGGLIEMTNGCNIISSININTILKLAIISFFISFSGLSVILQVYSFISKYNFSLKKYVKYKFYQGIVSACSCTIIYYFMYTNNTSNVFNENGSIYYNFFAIIGIELIIFIIPYLLYRLIKSFHVS